MDYNRTFHITYVDEEQLKAIVRIMLDALNDKKTKIISYREEGNTIVQDVYEW